MDEKIKDRLKGLPRFDTKEDALRVAVKRAQEDKNATDMVMRQKDGKFLVVGWVDWEIAVLDFGCEPVYSSGYIYDLSVGRETSQEQNQMELDVIMGRNRASESGGVKKAMSYTQARKE